MAVWGTRICIILTSCKNGNNSWLFFITTFIWCQKSLFYPCKDLSEGKGCLEVALLAVQICCSLNCSKLILNFLLQDHFSQRREKKNMNCQFCFRHCLILGFQWWFQKWKCLNVCIYHQKWRLRLRTKGPFG